MAMASGPSPPSGSPTGACSLPASAARSAAVSRASNSSRRAGGPSSPDVRRVAHGERLQRREVVLGRMRHDQHRIRRRVAECCERCDGTMLDDAVRIPAAGREQGRAMVGQPGEPAERAQDTEQRRRFRPRAEQQHQRRRLQRDGRAGRQVRRELVPGQQRGAPRLVQRHQRVVDRGGCIRQHGQGQHAHAAAATGAGTEQQVVVGARVERGVARFAGSDRRAASSTSPGSRHPPEITPTWTPSSATSASAPGLR